MTVLSVVYGGGAMMAIAGANPGAEGAANENQGQGAQNMGSNSENLDGTASQTENDRMGGGQGDEHDFDARGLSRKIMELQPMKTPFDQITRHATNGEKPKGMKYEFASIGSRPITTKIKTTTGAMTGMSLGIDLEDPACVSVDDVLVVPSVKAITRYDGKPYTEVFGKTAEQLKAVEKCPSLMLKVCGISDTDSKVVVYALNGGVHEASKQNIIIPTIPGGTVVNRLAKAVNEGASQTGRTAELPNTDVQFLQIFMAQAEESLIHKLTQRDVDGLDLSWHERRTLEDMRMVQEGTFLFSDMACISNHPKENNNKVWTTLGAWFQAGKDVVLGHRDENDNLVVEDDDLVDVNKDLFTGEGTGGKKKLWFAGSEFVTNMEKIKSDKFRLKGDVQAWDLTFNSWKTNLGEAEVIHCETFDKYGKSDKALSLDPEYFEKKVLLSLDRSAMDFNALGVRATQGVVLKEISAVVLYSPDAHARVSLA